MNSVYLITNKITGKYYIGQTIMRVEERFNWHCYYSRSREFHSDIFKYGKQNFKIETLCVCPSIEAMNKAEEFFIEFMGSRKKSFGYNKVKGGAVRLSSDKSFNEMREFIRKIHKNKSEYNKFVNYDLFKMPEGHRRAYEKIIRMEGYKI